MTTNNATTTPNLDFASQMVEWRSRALKAESEVLRLRALLDNRSSRTTKYGQALLEAVKDSDREFLESILDSDTALQHFTESVIKIGSCKGWSQTYCEVVAEILYSNYQRYCE